MAQIIVEGKMQFDRTINTEDRFALRNWYANFVNAFNSDKADAQKIFLSEQLSVEGFTREILDSTKFLQFMDRHRKRGDIKKIRFPETQMKMKNQSYVLTGSFEGYTDSNILSYEGSMELEVVKEQEKFLLKRFRFYPRLMAQK